MGLDVYLYYSEDINKAKHDEATCSEYSNEVWANASPWEDLVPSAREALLAKCRAFNLEHDCDEDGSSTLINREPLKQVNSSQYPEHMFKLNYLRSSYNDGGINNVMRRSGCPTLNDIFQPTDEYYLRPDWTAALIKVNEAIETYGQHLTGPMAGYDAMRVSDFGAGAATAQSALVLLAEQLDKRSDRSFNSYSNRDGEWFLDGIEVVGVVPNKGYGGGAWLLTKSKEQPDAETDWYMQALKVTREMIEKVLRSDNPENFFLAWSA